VGHPLRLENRLKAARKAAVFKSVTISRCTAFVAKQINNARYTLQGWILRLNCSFAKYGPAKSILTIVNGRDGVMRCAGKFPMYGVYGRGLTFAHCMHFRYVCFAIVNPLIGQ